MRRRKRRSTTIDVGDQTTAGNLVFEKTPHSNIALPEHIFRM